MAQLLLVILIAGLTLGQVCSAADDVKVEANRFRVVLNDGQIQEIHDGELTALGLSGASDQDSTVFIGREDILALYCRVGDTGKKGARTGALIGAAVGGMFYLGALVGAHNDPYDRVNHSTHMAVLSSAIAVSAGIGALIDMRSRKWERVPLEPEVGYNPETGEVKFAVTFSF
ncbi:MAG: hypothetical protein JSV52_12005 [Candidatus Zixiibacteriota bacterium]|nr:MAG: hypothetical protein JSV52_12005 [candidate division Zixibacteria bacterium]